MKTKELLNEWKSFLEKEMLNEISIKKFQEQYPDFDIISFSPQLKGNTDYLDIIKNSIEAGEQHSPDDYAQQFDFYKNSIEQNRKNKEFLTVNIPGGDLVSLEGKLNQGSYTATYNDIQQFQQARLEIGKGSKNKLANVYIKALEEASESDFELITENNEWIIFYPKSIVGSIALARSYWDGNKVTYDNTFQASQGFGQNTGVMKWCTSVSGGGNMFLNYHRRLNLHMYYCIKKNISNIEDKDRKLCISFSKRSKPKLKIEFSKGSSSVNGNNRAVSEEDSKNYLGSLFDDLLKDVAREKRLEIDIKSYYKSISLEQYIIMRAANEENISDFKSEVVNILQYSKDADKIAKNAAKDSSSDIRVLAASNIETPEILSDLAKDEDIEIRVLVARNKRTPPEALEFLAKDEHSDVSVRICVANNSSTHPDTLRFLIKDEDSSVKISAASNIKTPEILSDLAKDKDRDVRSWAASNIKNPETLSDLAKDEDSNVRISVASNSSIPPKVLKFLAKDKDSSVRHSIAYAKKTPPEILEFLAEDEDSDVRNSVARNINTPPETLEFLAEDEDVWVRKQVCMNIKTHPDTLRFLAKDEDSGVKNSVVSNRKTPPDAIEFLAKDEDKYTKRLAIFRLKELKNKSKKKARNESVLKQYIKTLLN